MSQVTSSRVTSDLRDQHHRTNSLGSATIDCHTCSVLKARCDRQRPQCGTCRSSRRRCGGFAIDLVWKDFALPDEATDIATDAAHVADPTPRTGAPREFRFVQGRPKTKRKARKTHAKVYTASSHSRGRPRSFVVTTSSDFARSRVPEDVSPIPESVYDTPSPRSYSKPDILSGTFRHVLPFVTASI